MANIPLYDTRETYTGKSDKAFTLEGERTRPVNIPFVEDKKLEGIANTLNYIGDKMTEAEELDQYNVGLTNMKKGADAIVEEADTEWRELSLDEHMDAFELGWAQLQDELSEGVKSNNTKRALAAQLETTRLGTQAAVRGMAHKRVYDRLISNAVAAKDGWLNDAIDAPNEQKAMDAMTELYNVNVGLANAGAITDTQAAANNQVYESQLNLGYLKRFVEEHYDYVIEDELRIRTPKEVRDFLNKKVTFKNTDEPDKDEIVRHAFAVYKDNHLSKRQKKIDADKARKKLIEDNDFTAIIMYNEKKLDRVKLNQHAVERNISREMYEKIANSMEGYDKNPAIAEGPESTIIIGQLASQIELGEDVTEELKNAYMNDLISRDTYIAYKTKMVDDGYKRGLRDINAMYRPLPYETITQDQAERVRKKHADAIREYNELLRRYVPQEPGDTSPPKLFTPIEAADWVNNRRRQRDDPDVTDTTKDTTIDVKDTNISIQKRLESLNKQLQSKLITLQKYMEQKAGLDREFDEVNALKSARNRH